MTTRNVGCWLALTAMLVNAAGPVWAQGVVAPVPPPPQPTLWSFLGIPQAFKAVREGGINRSGNHPALEKKPPLKKIADPANLVSDNPAIKKAAEIKKEEDLKWQKIKAIKYLTTIGCGCYNRDGSITDALMKAMDDCTEEVRYATVLAITGAAGGEMCANCKMRSCCSEEVSNKLYELAYERDDEGCFLEPSERVRLAAAEAMRVCCPGRGDDFFVESGPPAGEIPQGGEQPGIVQPPGGERPLDAPPPVPPLVPTPAPPMPPAPQPQLRPISEPIQSHAVAPPVRERAAPRATFARQDAPRSEIHVSEPTRSEIRISEAPRAIASQPSPIVTPAEAPPRTVARPITATPIINPTIPSTIKPAVTEPAPAAAKPSSSRRTASLPAAESKGTMAQVDKPAPASSAPAARLASAPFSATTPHWTVGAKTPTVYISQPIKPARPIEPAKTEGGVKTDDSASRPDTRPAASGAFRQASATLPTEGSPESTSQDAAAQAPPEREHLAPIIPAAAMRRLPSPDDSGR